jgi:small subunit ribosomal protein S17
MTKTIVVRVQRRFPHAQYKKIITAYKKFYAHDEKARPRWATRCALRKRGRSPN